MGEKLVLDGSATKINSTAQDPGTLTYEWVCHNDITALCDAVNAQGSSLFEITHDSFI